MIDVRDVWKNYGSLAVLKGLTLQVPTGQTLVILGRSGVGKSVLLKQILGLEKPDKGFIEIDGVRINELNERALFEVMKSMGMLFQNAALFDSLTVGENTGFYLINNPDPLTGEMVSQAEIDRRVTESLEMVGLAGTEHKLPGSLSGGMKKRAALARLIIYKPKVLLYDEPTAGLDPITTAQINALIVKTKHQLKATSIVVTHDLRSAMEIGDLIAFHHEGKIYYVAEKEEFFKSKDPLLRSFFENAIVPESAFAL